MAMDSKALTKAYIDTVCKKIHYKKLRTRIREEISNHFNDVLEDIRYDYPTEEDAVKAVWKQMGDPNELGKELRKANRKVLIPTAILKIVITIVCIIGLPQLFVYCGHEINTYVSAYNIEEFEQLVSEQYNDGEPIKFITEYKNNGYLFRIYFPEEQVESGQKYMQIASIKVFGISVYDKFISSSCDSYPYISKDTPYNIMVCDVPFGTNDRLNTINWIRIYTVKSDAKYFRRCYKPIDSNTDSELYWSKFIEYPQYATYEQPVVVYEDTPKGYEYIGWEIYDENKKIIEIKSEPSTDSNTNSSGISAQSSFHEFY